MKNLRLLSLLLFIPCFAIAQDQKKPKLVVGIVVDQMRYDLLYRFSDFYSPNGFKKLFNNSLQATHLTYNYVPTYTAPGHSSIYTGTYPSIHGIIGNNWYEASSQKKVYCTQDDEQRGVGSDNRNGKMSPKRLLSTTISDQLKLYQAGQNKSIAIALKDRGAILPGGFMCDAAYWYDDQSGKFITSTYYRKDLPQWVLNFNNQNHPTRLLAQGWKTLKPIDQYVQSFPDNSIGEDSIGNPKKTTFDYQFSKPLEDIKLTPMGNTLTTDFAIEALKSENLGKSNLTDMLMISYSSPDYIGHNFGPYSKEIQDCYIRLDLDIANLLKSLDAQVGQGNYLLFLTADHGVQDIPAFGKSHDIACGLHDYKENLKSLTDFMEQNQYTADFIYAINEQIYLKPSYSLKMEECIKKLNETFTQGVSGFYELSEIYEASIPMPLKERIINGYYPKRSGQIYMLTEPNWVSHSGLGTSHGSPYSHDSHVPFLMYGSGVKPMKTSKPYHITDIAPTICNYLGILHPSGSIGRVIEE